MTHVRRTLLGAGIGALLAMVFVPCIHQGYEPIFNAAEYRINVAQLVLNISFAALVGALAFNLSRRALCWSAASAILIVTALFGLPAYHEQMRSGAVTEEGLAYAAAAIPDLGLAKEHMLRAANYSGGGKGGGSNRGRIRSWQLPAGLTSLVCQTNRGPLGNDTENKASSLRRLIRWTNQRQTISTHHQLIAVYLMILSLVRHQSNALLRVPALLHSRLLGQVRARAREGAASY